MQLYYYIVLQKVKNPTKTHKCPTPPLAHHASVQSSLQFTLFNGSKKVHFPAYSSNGAASSCSHMACRSAAIKSCSICCALEVRATQRESKGCRGGDMPKRPPKYEVEYAGIWRKKMKENIRFFQNRPCLVTHP